MGVLRTAGAALSLGILALAVASPPAGAVEYLKAVEDIPVFDGLHEQHDALVFESPYGRVIKSQIEGRAAPPAVLSFYLSSLPALGWQRDGASLTFTRGFEKLKIEVIEGTKPADPGVRVVFDLVVRVADNTISR
jgi:hypothetical protein